MKYLLSIAFSLCFSFGSAQTNPSYDAALARKLDADDYGMKQYVLAILKTGTNTTTDSTIRNRLFRGHMNNINRLAKEGKLVVAGPLGKNDKSYRGIFILNAANMDEARAMVETDPAVKEKMFEVELYEWYGSAALPEYLPYHDKVQKEKI